MATIGLLAGTIRAECRRRADGLALEYGSLFFMAATTLWGLAFLYLPFELDRAEAAISRSLPSPS